MREVGIRELVRTGLLWLVAALALLVAYYWFQTLMGMAVDDTRSLTDLMVYRGSVLSMLDGHGLYDYQLVRPEEAGLPFTYPPFAALVFVPLALLPFPVAAWVVIVASFAVVVLLALVMLRRGSRWQGRPVPALPVVLVSLALLISEPVAHGVMLGQISIFLVAATLVDACGLLPRRWQGVLIGLAGAIKLIPMIFVPYFLVTRQWRRAAVSTVTFLLATALGFVVLPAESVRYWTQLIFETGRVGDVAVSRNKSLLGLLVRWGLVADGQRALWLVLAVVFLVLGLWAAGRHYRRGEELAAVLVVGVLSIVLTPISWPHHQVWMSLAGVYLVLQRRRWCVVAWALLLVGYVYATPLFSWEETGPLWLRLVWELPALAAMAIAVVGLPKRSPSAEEAPQPATAATL